MVERFYSKYQPLITRKHQTCVGLGFELLSRLNKLNNKYTGIANGLYLVSCEETIGDIEAYVGGPPAADSGEKEHVLVCLKIVINGRRGVLLLDPGYHVARVVTVMADKMYPHTGWFTQSDEPECKKEYNYSLCQNDNDYVEWHERQTRPGALEQTQVALIYVARPYLTAIDVTERRNLVYNYRSLVSRDTKGHVTAALYFSLGLDNIQTFTIFYRTSNGTKRKIKIPFNKLRSTTKTGPTDEELQMIAECGRQMDMSCDEIDSLLEALAKVMSDTSFIAQVLAINSKINTLAEDN